jgi:hypothetical protein
MDKWLEETNDINVANNGVGDPKVLVTPKQSKRRAKPIEPQDCPKYSTIHKSFMNQICDDCLAAESGGSEVGVPLPEASSPLPDKGREARIRDSEFNVVVGDMQFQLLPNSRQQVGPTQPRIEESDGEQRIFDSNVEITIVEETEADHETLSISEEETSSPLFSRSNGSSRSSSVVTLPRSDHENKFQSRGNRRYGVALPKGGKLDWNDADDELEEAVKLDWPPDSLIRGRPLTRGNVNGFQRCDSGPEERYLPSRTNGLARFKTLRSISDTLRPSTRAKGDVPAESETSSKIFPAPARPNTLFRSLRMRKSSPLIAESIEVNEFDCATTGSATRTGANIGPRKVSLKTWARSIIPDRKKSQRVERSLSPIQTRSPAPSPTSSWTRNQIDDHADDHPILNSPSETAFDTESIMSSLENTMEKTHIDSSQVGSQHSPRLASMHSMVTEDTTKVERRTPASDGDDQKEDVQPSVHSVEVVADSRRTTNSGLKGLVFFPEDENQVPVVNEHDEDDPKSVWNASSSKSLPAVPQSMEILSPKSALMKSIIESNVPRPHPPRKSSLRLPQTQTTMTVSDFEFPLPARSRTFEGLGISRSSLPRN